MCFLKIVILHCHYERGGVTQVVENHVRSLLECSHVDQIVLASGDRASGLSAHTLAAVEKLSIAGFDYDDCVSFHGDSTSHEVTWNDKRIDDLKGRVIRLEFLLTKADLYTFRASPQP